MLFTESMLKEVIKCLGKEHAFAIVAHQSGASALLSAIRVRPSLAGFMVLRDPILEGIEVDPLHTIFHPVLCPHDPDGHPAVSKATRALMSVLPEIKGTK